MITTVARVGTVRLGRQRSPDKQTGRFATKYLRAANVTSEGLDLSEVFEMDFTPAEREVYGLKQGDIVLAEASGTASQVGRAALWSDEIPGCCFQNTVIRFRPHAVVSEYALIVFRHYAERGAFGRTARGVGIQHLGASRFAQMPFPLPPLAEQNWIATEVEQRLARLREAVASLRSALQRIDEQNREILAAAVSGDMVEPEAVVAVREGRALDEATFVLVGTNTKQQPQHALFDEDPSDATTAQPSQPLPPGWAWTTVGAAGELKLGRQRSPKHEGGDHPTPYLRVANVQEDYIDFDDLMLMNFSPEERVQYKLQRGDILLNVGQSPELVGRPALIRRDISLICFQNHLVRFRSKPFLNPEYALLVFRHYLHSGTFRSIARWSTNLATLSLSSLASLRFPLPPAAEQARIVTEAHRRLEMSKVQETAVRASLNRIGDMKQELFAAAVSGLLVSQSELDEPAAKLLERLGPPPAEAVIESSDNPMQEGMMSARGTLGEPLPRRSLSEVLRGTQRQLRVPELFALAGYDRDSTEDVEQFYLSLRSELGQTMRQVSGDGENALLEAVPDAT